MESFKRTRTHLHIHSVFEERPWTHLHTSHSDFEGGLTTHLHNPTQSLHSPTQPWKKDSKHTFTRPTGGNSAQVNYDKIMGAMRATNVVLVRRILLSASKCSQLDGLFLSPLWPRAPQQCRLCRPSISPDSNMLFLTLR